jgi:hypothetical protein
LKTAELLARRLRLRPAGVAKIRSWGRRARWLLEVQGGVGSDGPDLGHEGCWVRTAVV